MNRRLIKNTWSLTACAVLGSGALFAQGCGKVTASSASDFSISGSLATSSSRVSVRDQIVNAEFENLVMRTQSTMRVALDAYSVRCVTLTGTPAVGEGTCDSAGAFSLTLAGAAGNPVGCFVLSGTSIIAVMSFEGSDTGIDGDTTSSSSLVPGSGATGLKLGAISVNLAKGTATVPVSQIETLGDATPSTSGTWANMQNDNGWTIHAIPAANLPSGVKTAVAAGSSGDHGPQDGMKVFLAQYAANDVVGSGTHIGLSLWDASGATAKTKYDACTSGGSNGEGAELDPAQITAVAGPNNNALKLTNPPAVLAEFPNPAGIIMQHAVCGLASSVANGTNDCADIPALMEAAYDPGNTLDDTQTLAAMTASPGGYTSANTFARAKNQCMFQCVLNGITSDSQSSSCAARGQVNWNKMFSSGGTPVFTATFDPSHNGTVWSGIAAPDAAGVIPGGGIASYYGGAVVFGKTPRARFMFNELVVSGNVGSLTDKETEEREVCKTYNSNGQCTASAMCHKTRMNAMTITQTASSGGNATAATVQLITTSQFDPADDAACATSGMFEDAAKESFLFTITAS